MNKDLFRVTTSFILYLKSDVTMVFKYMSVLQVNAAKSALKEAGGIYACIKINWSE